MEIIIIKSNNYKKLYELNKVMNRLCYPSLNNNLNNEYYTYDKTMVFLSKNIDNFHKITRAIHLFSTANSKQNIIVYTNSKKLIDNLFEFIDEYNSFAKTLEFPQANISVQQC